MASMTAAFSMTVSISLTAAFSMIYNSVYNIYSYLFIYFLSGEWFVNFKERPALVLYAPPAATKAELTIKIDDEDFDALSRGTLNPMYAMAQGKLKLSGNMSLATQLRDLFKNPVSKL